MCTLTWMLIAHAGQAWVGLRPCLGQPQDHGHDFSKGRDSPCKQCRRARQVEERKGNIEKHESESEMVETDESNDAEEARILKNLEETLKMKLSLQVKEEEGRMKKL